MDLERPPATAIAVRAGLIGNLLPLDKVIYYT
jgi:hypothetical protein